MTTATTAPTGPAAQTPVLPWAKSASHHAATLLGVATLLTAFSSPPHARAASPADMLTYEPYRAVHSISSAPEVDRYLAKLDAYGIGQALLQTPAFTATGTMKIPDRDKFMLALWAQQAELYNSAHGTGIIVTAVFNGEVGTPASGLDLDNPATRANMVAGIKSVLTAGIAAVHLDLEPYPVTPGFLSLLEEIDALFLHAGLQPQLSVVAPGYAWRWTPDYLRQISERVTQINPLYYDSSIDDIAAYEGWIVRSLQYYTANIAATARLVPVLPSYSANPWHRPGVENIATATSALGTALAAGARVNGAGIWWWWGFFYDEEGAYDASADRHAWQTGTTQLPFSP